MEKIIKTKEQRKGITLVSLVITIIVLLILAGITINLIIGEDGIIRRAQEAGKNYIDAAENEKLQLGVFTNEMDNLINGSTNANSTNYRTGYNDGFISGAAYVEEKITNTLTSGVIASEWMGGGKTFTLFTETTDKIYNFTWGTNYQGSYWIDYVYIYFYNSDGTLKHEIQDGGMSGNWVSSDKFTLKMNKGDYIVIKYQLSNNNGNCRITLPYSSVSI